VAFQDGEIHISKQKSGKGAGQKRERGVSSGPKAKTATDDIVPTQKLQTLVA